MTKALILYYSFEGSTRKVAQYLSKELNIPCEEIKPIKPIKAKGFLKYVLGGGQAISGVKPDLRPLLVDLKNYDTIIVGSPVWAGRFTPAIKTLIENILQNKKIAFFYCSGGGPGKVENFIRSSVELHNSLLSTHGLTMLGEDTKTQEKSVLDWAGKIIRS